ncbi:hypothetical protein [Streptomyces armeniacus]|uniref:DUF7848 domain-containing protein n=1 Tax=Streptomyces armeniacus TaxID=83291 RepID=UPI001AD8381B|nr:hypothetical protein [Streptomyces armeniacus]
MRDEATEPTYEAECASGEITCCESSGAHRHTEPVEVWMRQHAADTGHRRYLRLFSDYAVVLEPTEESTRSDMPERSDRGSV